MKGLFYSVLGTIVSSHQFAIRFKPLWLYILTIYINIYEPQHLDCLHVKLTLCSVFFLLCRRVTGLHKEAEHQLSGSRRVSHCCFAGESHKKSGQ